MCGDTLQVQGIAEDIRRFNIQVRFHFCSDIRELASLTPDSLLCSTFVATYECMGGCH
jgi:hypothetical protein